MKFKKVLLFLVIFISFNIVGQSPQTKQADKFFDLYQYQKAIKAYKNLLKTDRKDRLYIYRKLGDAYYSISDPYNAETWYSKTIRDPRIDPVYYFKYAMVLRQNQKYDDSYKWMLTYKKKSGMSDSRLQEFFKESDIVDKLLKKGPQCELTNLDLNSEFTEYGGVFYQDSLLVYTTNNIKTSGKRVSEYDNLPFTDLYLARPSGKNYIKYKNFSPKINTGFHESSPTFNSDHTVMFFTRNNLRPGKIHNIKDYNLKIYRSFYIDGEWSKPEEVHFDSNRYDCAHPVLSKDNKTLYFASDMPGSYGLSDIYKVDVKKDWTLGVPVNLGPQINTEGSETFPFIDEYDNLYFSSDGHAGMGGLDIFVAFYINKNFIALKNMGLPYNSAKDDFAFAIFQDQKKGFLSSNRFGGKGSDDIYMFTNYEEIKPLFYLKGVTQTEKGEIIPRAIVKLYENGQIKDSTISLPNGKYRFVIEPHKRYLLKGFKTDYNPAQRQFTTYDIHEPVIIKDLILSKVANINLKGCITDLDTNEALPDSEIRVYENSNESVLLKTDDQGCFNYKISPDHLNKHLHLEIEARNNNYLPRRVFFDTIVENKNYFVPIQLVKFKIEPIHFDFDKWNIRPDATVILNRLVKLMKQYPTMEISMESHTDARGTDEYNQELSQKRAKSTMDYLIKHGIDASRLKAKGFGETRIKNQCWNDVKCSEKEHQVNRRTEFVITKI